MGSTQSSQHSGSITIVNPNPDTAQETEKVFLPPRVAPILTIDGRSIDSKRHGQENRLDSQIWIDLVNEIDRFIQSRAELVSSRQRQLQEKILLLEDHVQRFTDSYVNDTHKALARLNDGCRKTEELKQSLNKCFVQSEICISMLDKLNLLLPETHRLEAFNSEQEKEPR